MEMEFNGETIIKNPNSGTGWVGKRKKSFLEGTKHSKNKRRKKGYQLEGKDECHENRRNDAVEEIENNVHKYLHG